jgi:hypothetical protein
MARVGLSAARKHHQCPHCEPMEENWQMVPLRGEGPKCSGIASHSSSRRSLRCPGPRHTYQAS